MSMWIPAPFPTKRQPQAQSLQKQAIYNIARLPNQSSIFPDAPNTKNLLKDYHVSHHRRYAARFQSSPLNPNPNNTSASPVIDPEIGVPQQIIHLANAHVKNPSETLHLLCDIGLHRDVNLRKGWEGRMDLKDMRNAEAFAMTAVGEVQEGLNRCDQCQRGEGPFTECVVVSGCEKGACGCCVYGSGDGNPKCSLWFGKGFVPKEKIGKAKDDYVMLDTTAIEEAIERGFAQRFTTDGPPPKYPPELTRLSLEEFNARGVVLQKAFDRIEKEVIERQALDKVNISKYRKFDEMTNRQLLSTWDGLSNELTDWKRVMSAKRLRLWDGWYQEEMEEAKEGEARNTKEVTRKEDNAENSEAKEGTTVHTKEEETKAIKNILSWLTKCTEQQAKAESMGATTEETTDAGTQVQQPLLESVEIETGHLGNSQDITEVELTEVEFGETAGTKDGMQESQTTTGLGITMNEENPHGYRQQGDQQQQSTETSPLLTRHDDQLISEYALQQTSTETSQSVAEFNEPLMSEDGLQPLFEQQLKETQQAGKRNKTPPDDDDDETFTEPRQSKKIKSSAE